MRRWPCAGTGGVRSSLAPSTSSGRYWPWKCTCSSWSVSLNMSTEVCRPCFSRSNGPGKPPLYIVVETNRSGASSSTPGAMRRVCSALPCRGTDAAADMAWPMSPAAAPAAGNSPAASADRLAVFRKSRRSMSLPLTTQMRIIRDCDGAGTPHWCARGRQLRRRIKNAAGRSGLGARTRLAVVARAEDEIPQAGGHAEIRFGMVVMDVVEAGPAAHRRILEAVHVDHDVAGAVGRVTGRDGQCEQRAQRAHEKRRHEERQRVVAERVHMVARVAGFERTGVAVEQPAVRGVFDEGEGEQAAEYRHGRGQPLHVAVPDAGG